MKQHFFTALRTLVIIISLITSQFATVIQAGAAELAPIEAPLAVPAEESPLAEQPSAAHDVLPPSSLPAPAQGSPAECALSGSNALYNAGSTLPVAGAETQPLPVGSPLPFVGGSARTWDMPPGMSTSIWGFTPVQNITQQDGSAYPVATNLEQPERASAVADRGAGAEPTRRQFASERRINDSPGDPGNNYEEYLDLRVDPATNFRALRNSNAVVMLWVRNVTDDPVSCLGAPQDVYFASAVYELHSASGRVAGPITVDGTAFQNTVTGDLVAEAPQGGVIPNTPNSSGLTDAFYLAPITIPANVADYVELRVQYNFTLQSAPATNRSITRSYIALVGGPFLQIVASPSNPQRLTLPVGVVGGTGAGVAGAREAGENAWFVIDLTSLAGQNNDASAVRVISDNPTLGSISECRTTTEAGAPLGSAPPGNQANEGYFRFSPANPSFDVLTGLNNIDPAGFTPATFFGQQLGYNDNPGNIYNLQLNENERVFCVFQRSLSSATGIYSLEGNLRAFSYPANDSLISILPVFISFPIGLAQISVSKRVTGPVDPTTGQVRTLVAVGETVSYEITITNTGDLPVNRIRIDDSLTGQRLLPRQFDPLPAGRQRELYSPRRPKLFNRDHNPISGAG
ncbi:MAG: hypothetical protein HC915_00730 [Anaerolineae bacterium]|nr:hypothetical protein [Anaerolineae bacterium]